MTEIETDRRYLCRDGYIRRVGRSWDDGTLTWILDPVPAILLTLDGLAAGTCTTETFAEMVSAAIGESWLLVRSMRTAACMACWA